MPSGIDIFGVVSGVLGMLGLVASARRTLTPSHRLRELDSAIHSCERLLISAHEEFIRIEPTLAERASERVFL
jgi:hypothetical protein